MKKRKTYFCFLQGGNDVETKNSNSTKHALNKVVVQPYLEVFACYLKISNQLLSVRQVQ
jgi:hypothetical protein